MAAQQRTVDLIMEQASAAGDVSARRMFGEFGLYLGGKLISLVCDDQLYLKPTSARREFAGPAPEAPPYPGAKPQLLIEDDRWDDADWLAELVRVTAAALPAPASKKAKAN